MRLLVCGDRNWDDAQKLHIILSTIHGIEPIDTLIEGCATGADWLAGAHDEAGWAYVNHVNNVHFPARWETYGKAAGPIRNQLMLDVGRPGMVVAFHTDIEHSRGTKDMIRRARLEEIPVRLFTGKGWLRGEEIEI